MTIFSGNAIFRQFVGTFSTNSVTNVDLLDNAGGSTIILPYTKAAGTDLLVTIRTPFYASGASSSCVLSVNDGSTDWQCSIGRAFTTSSRRGLSDGGVMITGLGAGAYNLKARVRVVSGNTVNFSAAEAVSMSVLECGTGYINGACQTRFCVTGHTYTSTPSDLLDAPGGNTIAVSLNKRAATSKIWVYGRANFTASTQHNPMLSVYDGTTGTNLGTIQVNSSGYGDLIGAVELTGHPAGTVNLKLRAASSNNTATFGGNTSSGTIWAIEVP